MDIQKIDLLLQYALAVASEEDDFKNQRLGAIHLIKYVYLADLAYAPSYPIQNLALKIDIIPRNAIKKWVHQFGADTESLLAHVYLTQPLLTAAPGENLNFGQVKIPEEKKENTGSNCREFSSNRKNTKILVQIKQQIQAKLAFKKAQKKHCANSFVAPRYDTVFFRGQEWLDSHEGNAILPS